MPEPRYLGGADVQYGDWHGTVALDDSDDGGALYALFGVEPPDEWSIVGLSISGGNATGGKTWAAVYAVSASDLNAAGDVSALAAAHGGSLPVTEFELHDADVASMLFKGGFKRWNLRATYGLVASEELPLEITDTRERD
jgi:hypothetical protein